MTIQRSYVTALESCLSQVFYEGYSVVERWELLTWFGHRERITNVVWREIQEVWEDLFELEKNKAKLLIVKCDQKSPQKFVIIREDMGVGITSLF